MRRIYENCLCLSITGKLRELWSFVFLCKAAKLTLTVSLSTPQEYRWVSDELSGKIDEMLGGNIAMDQYLIPGRGGGGKGGGVLLVASCYIKTIIVFSSISKPSKNDKREKTKIKRNRKIDNILLRLL